MVWSSSDWNPTVPNLFPTLIHGRNPKDSGNVQSGEPGCTDSITTKSLMFHHLTPPLACWCPSESRPTATRKRGKKTSDSLPSRSHNAQTRLPALSGTASALLAGSLCYLQRSSALESVALRKAAPLPHFSGISSDISVGDSTKRPLTVLLPPPVCAASAQ